MLYRGGDSIVTVLYIVRLPGSICPIEVVTVLLLLYIVRLLGSTCPIEVVTVLLLCCMLYGYQILHAL